MNRLRLISTCISWLSSQNALTHKCKRTEE
uniref:Uncharacterized protein n=2 Tax=Anguilla anguilla TaxID=7936 RepID=A0A0E9TZA8_ANGAN